VKHARSSERARGIAAIKSDVRARLASCRWSSPKVADPEFMQGAPYRRRSTSTCAATTWAELQRISDELVALAGARAVDVSSSLVSGKPEMVARVNRELAADLGFSVGASRAAARHGRGRRADAAARGRPEYDVRVRLAPEHRNDFASIARTPLYSPTGSVVRTGDIVRMEPALGPSSIEREQRRRQAKIGIDSSAARSAT
jgi:multidrug efflux pump subunit AcrB